jgi:hypothetical protein
MKKPRAKQRGTSNRFEVFRVSRKCPSCLAGYFTWPQVALTHHACHRCLYAPRTTTVKAEDFLEIVVGVALRGHPLQECREEEGW